MTEAAAMHRETSPSEAHSFGPEELSLQTFAKAFVASLAEEGIDTIYPHDERDVAGFEAVIQQLDSDVQAQRKEGLGKEEILPLLRVANELRASNTGSYDGFEAALRSLQLTFTSSPNPFYTMIKIPVTRAQAQSFAKLLSSRQFQLAQRAAKAFIAARKHART